MPWAGNIAKTMTIHKFSKIQVLRNYLPSDSHTNTAFLIALPTRKKCGAFLFLHCKALSTAKYKRYINTFIIYCLLLPVKMTSQTAISNGNRTEWSPIRSVIIIVKNKSDSRCAVVRFCYHSYDYRPNWTPFSPITITNHGLWRHLDG